MNKKIFQQILDTLIMCAVIFALGFLASFFHWDDTDPINYRIETPAPFSLPKFIKVRR